MSEELNQLNNIRLLRALGRETEISVLEDMLDKLRAVVEERRESETAEVLQIQAHREKIEQYRQLFQEEGISLNELAAGVPAKSKSASSRRVKYQ